LTDEIAQILDDLEGDGIENEDELVKAAVGLLSNLRLLYFRSFRGLVIDNLHPSTHPPQQASIPRFMRDRPTVPRGAVDKPRTTLR
jgi:hypothetical protein